MSTQRVEFAVPIPEALHQVVSSSLPREWRERFEILRLRDGMVVKARDILDALHTLEIRWLSLETPGILRGPRLAYAYGSELADHDAEGLERYVSTLRRLCSREEELLPFLSRQMDVSEGSLLGSQHFSESQLLEALGGKRKPEVVEPVIRDFVRGRLGEQVGGSVDLYLENPCEQSCIFCVFPRMRELEGHKRRQEKLKSRSAQEQDIFSLGAFGAMLSVLRALDPAPALRINGNDWARHPHVGKMLDCLKTEKDVPIRFLGPSTVLKDSEFVGRLAAISTLEGVTLTLLSVDDARHDAIVGQAGSAADVKVALKNLLDAGIRVWANIVLVADTMSEIPRLLSWLGQQGVVCALHAFFPDEHPEGWSPALLPSAKNIREVLESLDSEQIDAIDVLVGLPTCAVPPVLRQRLEPLWKTDEREGRVYAECCESCFLRVECSGLAESYKPDAENFGLLPEKGVYG